MKIYWLRKLFNSWLLAFFGMSLFSLLSVEAATITAKSCSQEDVQAAIDQAAEGDTVLVPAGECTWQSTVQIGSAKWNGGGYDYFSKEITILGAGIDKTIIYDDVEVVNTRGPLFNALTEEGKLFQLSGFTFRTSPDLQTQKWSGVIQLGGTTKTFRVSHNKFETKRLSGNAIYSVGVFGVVDHNQFLHDGQAVQVHLETWNRMQYGDYSYATPANFGSPDAVFIEDNYLDGRTMTDAYGGGRYVVRYNQIKSNGIPIQNHGLDSTGRTRSVFSWEVYNNDVTLDGPNNLIHMRGGTGLVFNNIVRNTEASSSRISLGTLNIYRTSEDYRPFRTCDGYGPFDKNVLAANGQSKIFESGYHSAPKSEGQGDSGPEILIAENQGKNWAVDEWVGYSLRRVKNMPFIFDDINFSNLRLSLKGSAFLNPVILDAIGISKEQIDSVSDQNILNGLNAIIDRLDFYTNFGDDVIMTTDLPPLIARLKNGQTLSTKELRRLNIGLLNTVYYHSNILGSWGSKIISNTANTITTAQSANRANAPRFWWTGDEFEILQVDVCMDQVGRGHGKLLSGGTPSPIGWVEQVLEPVYAWGNEVNGDKTNKLSPTFYSIQRGREVREGETHPTYKPFVYPHPLVSGIPYVPPISGEDEKNESFIFHSFKNVFNPHKENLHISFEMTEPASVRGYILDRKGNPIREILNELIQANQEKIINWDGRNKSGDIVASGVYIVRFESSTNKVDMKVVVVK